MSNIFESNSAKLGELHSAVKIAYEKCQEGARRRIFDLYTHKHMIEMRSGSIDNCMPQLNPDAYDNQQRAP
jgi:hypothetical protein